MSASSELETADTLACGGRRIYLALLMGGGRFVWKHPGAYAPGDLDMSAYIHLSQTAERGCFDAVFLADAYSTKDDGMTAEALAGLASVVQFEPTVLFGAIAAATQNIGLITTGSTTYHQPYDFARRIASLDHMSAGRMGWNVITSQFTSEALNYNLDAQLSNADRYARAREFLDVVLGLWDSWEDDAFLRDRESGAYLDPTKMHVLDHKGRFFKVRGPLNVARMPQGYPVICQAGESEAAWDMAAQFADLMFCKVGTVPHGQSFYREMKGRVVKFGRRPDHLKLMPGLQCIPGRTSEEAWAKYDRVQACISQEEARQFGIQFMGSDFDLPGDPTEALPDTNVLNEIAEKKRMQLVQRGKRLSIVELGRHIGASMGHLTVVGTPGEIADTLQSFVDENACDGFTVMPHVSPANLEDFVDMVIPELQARGVVPREYEGRTLRDHLGLPRPENRYAVGRSLRQAG